jgi:exopolysaccharide biosynthesis polyprenyl glycosylphosphotransferase
MAFISTTSAPPAVVAHSDSQYGTSTPLAGHARYRAEDRCKLSFGVSDSIATLGALILGFYARFDLLGSVLPPESFFAPIGVRAIGDYANSILLGALLLQLILYVNEAYANRTLLRFRRTFFVLFKSLIIWAISYAGISRILEFDAHLSRLFIIISFLFLLGLLTFSRFAVQRIILKTNASVALRQRILFVDWTDRAATIAAAALRDRWSPYELVGCAPNNKDRFSSQPPATIPTLRSHQEAKALCEKGVVDIVVLADEDHNERDVVALARECEKSLVSFMVIPSGFQILLSGLNLTTIGGVPLLGVTKLPLNHPAKWVLKRAIDIVGASLGCVLSAPIIAVFALLVYRESPGPLFYRQLRVGCRGRLFHILKIRSMKVDAEKESGPRWATRNDERTLKIGAFMRRWNIDELPQFWNVLRGDLSLVGPRPERPELIKQFREQILYYNARHNIVPGMTGWAQVNGFRGDTDLSERIRCDIYYIENWNPLLDFQIMIMTFFRWQGSP